MNIIGIAGKIGTGKTVLARHLKDLLGDTIILNFGDLLKIEVSQKFKIPLDLCYSMEGKNSLVQIHNPADNTYSSKTVREVLQWYGTDIIRNTMFNHWVDSMKIILLEHIKNGQYDTAIIADIRFPNEADLITDLGGKNIRLRPYSTWNHDNDHESETSLDEYDKRRYFWLSIAPPLGTLYQTAKYIKELLSE